MENMKKIIGIGNSLVDVLVRLDDDGLLQTMDMPKGSMQLIDGAGRSRVAAQLAVMDSQKASGGSAANTIKALANMGVESAFIGKVGDDADGRFYGEDLEREGVVTCLSVMQGQGTGVASTLISPDGQRTFATYLGASACLDAADVTADMLRGYHIIYVEGYLVQNHALMTGALSLARELGLTVCLDLASYNVVAADLDFFRRLVNDYVDIVFANEEEALAFTGKEGVEAARDLARMCRTAVVKLGKAGACVCSGDRFAAAPAAEVAQVVDTTGAGDYFAAGFLYAYVNAQPLAQCLEWGGRLAAEVIQVVGTTLPKAAWQELKAMKI